MDDDDDFGDFGGFEAAEPVAPAEAQPAQGAQAAPSPWALYAAAAQQNPGAYQASQPDLIQPNQSAAQVPNVVAEVSQNWASSSAGESRADNSPEGAVGGCSATDRPPAYFDANFEDFCLDDAGPQRAVPGMRSLTEQVLEPDFGGGALGGARDQPVPAGVLDLDLAQGTPRSETSGSEVDLGGAGIECDLMSSTQPQAQHRLTTPPLHQALHQAPSSPRENSGPPQVDQERDQHSLEGAAAQPPAEQEGNQEVSQLQEQLSAVEREKIRIQQELQDLLQSHQNLETELNDTRERLEAQRTQYETLQGRHNTELSELREAGHEALTLIVQEYKGLCGVAVLEQQEKGERQLTEALAREAERWQTLLQQQQERFEEVLKEEQGKLEGRIEEAIKEQAEQHKVLLEEALEGERQKSKEAVQKALREEQERNRCVLEEALREERVKTEQLMGEEKEKMQRQLEEEREKSSTALAEAVKQERDLCQEGLESALREERHRGEETSQAVKDRVKQEMKSYVQECKQVDEASRRRALASMDLLLEGTRKQLDLLLRPDNNVPISASHGASHSRSQDAENGT